MAQSATSSSAPPSTKAHSSSMLRKIVSFIVKLTAVFFVGSVVLVIITRFVPIFITPLMVIRLVEGGLEGKWVGMDKTWVSLESISPAVQRAVIASEDARFLTHGGIDWEAVQEAQRRNERTERLAAQGKIKKKRLYGASTISMQTAKNAFLFPSRTYLRKALEAYFTYLMEFIWGKRRILEIYLNIIEMGSGVYGVEAASQRCFGKSAAQLTSREAALIAAVLPNPRKWSPVKPSGYIQRKASTIQARMNGVALPQ
ncbi:MAG: monofunctional biosynthetic peptidoglycan transglycosylase [Candidatus Kapabacteria bacterium]|jgi:monofunctional biosynthetic peptidoglycan transglycosylase|nr:monofunctional biosynthetic peptidoglycan transglycosylase [Candidatus Kapabacteria bacterium]